MCEYFHIPVCNTVTIGDSMNDREMLETAGLSICMENGSGELKKLVLREYDYNREGRKVRSGHETDGGHGALRKVRRHSGGAGGRR